MTMSKEDLIKFCRYFKGEAERPKDAPFWWGYEQIWVELSLNSKEGNANFHLMGEYLDNYLRAGLRTFCDNDDTPATMKALLYDRYTHFGGDAKSFKEWYINEYKKGKE